MSVDPKPPTFPWNVLGNVSGSYDDGRVEVRWDIKDPTPADLEMVAKIVRQARANAS